MINTMQKDKLLRLNRSLSRCILIVKDTSGEYDDELKEMAQEFAEEYALRIVDITCGPAQERTH
jgi:hypothetical protein